MSMMLPLAILTVGAILAGYLNFPERERSLGGFLGYSPSFVQAYDAASKGTTVAGEAFGVHDPRSTPEEHGYQIMILSGAIALLGIGLAYVMHLRDRSRAERLAGAFPLSTRLIEGKFYVDEIYRATVVEPLWALGRAFFWVDRKIIDGLVALLAWVPMRAGDVLRVTVQRGYLQGYATAMLFGIAVILLIIFL
jgi:NADH-quinone oxidoreductase subunit L